MSGDQDIPIAMRESRAAHGHSTEAEGEGTPRRLGPFFHVAAKVPWVARALRPLAVRVVPIVSPSVRDGTQANARHIFGRTLSRREQRLFARDVVRNFYDFVTDIGRFARQGPRHIMSLVERFDGEEAYRAARASNTGAVLVTAHMGSFEVGLAALSELEEHIHVVFKRDDSGPFESMRTAFRESLGVVESPIEDGLPMWLGLRQALGRGEVVVMQIDRAMRGQAAVTVDFLHGRLRIPTGGIWLARLTGSPIIPVFVIRTQTGRFEVRTFPSIDPGVGRDKPVEGDPAVMAITKALESMVAAYPTQWLNLRPAFHGNEATASTSNGI